MPPKSSTLTTLRGPTSLPEPAPPAPTRGIAAPLREGGWRRRLAIACGLVACGVLAACIWSELYPGDLRQAEQAYRRNGLRRTPPNRRGASRPATIPKERRPPGRSMSQPAGPARPGRGGESSNSFVPSGTRLEVRDPHAYPLMSRGPESGARGQLVVLLPSHIIGRKVLQC